MENTKEIKEIWEGQAEGFPIFLEKNPEIFPKVDAEQKKENEELVEELAGRMRKKIQQRPEEKELWAAWEKELEQEMEGEFAVFLEREKILSLSACMDEELLEAFGREAKRFIGRVRAFDEELSSEQIWQAMRNYLIYAMIVEMQGEEQDAGDSILGYSLLYPYTDNYIDDKERAKEEKERYNRMIAQKLKGEAVAPQGELEEKTCRLLDMVLDAYEGRAEKKVAGTLLQLLEAQHCSMEQLDEGITQERILEISIRKGGASVLADYLFAAKEWVEKEERFYLQFGFLLQLVDDLQDVETDKKEGSHTLMTEALQQKRLEEQVNRLLWFAWEVVGGFTPRNPGLKEFVRKNCVEITLAAVAMHASYFPRSYVCALEPYLPFSLDFIKRKRKQQKKNPFF